jgi:hypothetical protein
MIKGQFQSKRFNPANPTIIMENWIEPTLYNSGDCPVYYQGIPVMPKGVIVLGPSGVLQNGIIDLRFPESGDLKEVIVTYTTQLSCNS